MLKIQSTVYPDKTLSFNQVQALYLLQRTKDLRVFNEYCGSAKIPQELVDECLDSIQVNQLYNN